MKRNIRDENVYLSVGGWFTYFSVVAWQQRKQEPVCGRMVILYSPMYGFGVILIKNWRTGREYQQSGGQTDTFCYQNQLNAQTKGDGKNIISLQQGAPPNYLNKTEAQQKWAGDSLPGGS